MCACVRVCACVCVCVIKFYVIPASLMQSFITVIIIDLIVTPIFSPNNLKGTLMLEFKIKSITRSGWPGQTIAFLVER